MKTFVLVSLWLLALLMLALFSWGFVLYFGWPAWSSLGVFLFLIGGYFSIRLARRFWVVARSRAKFAQSEIEIAGEHDKKKSNVQALIDKWRAGIGLLRSSTLRRFGNPSYALPWYLIIGSSNSGKTSVISHSGLTASIQNRELASVAESTENIDWWFFNNAVFIDTAGRFVDSRAIETQAAWAKFLDLISRARFKEGISGLVLTIEAGHLLNGDTALLEQQARSARERIEELIRLFDSRFPVYLLITKCDQIPGFLHWADCLPRDELMQAFGYLGDVQDGSAAPHSFLSDALSAIESRLKCIRLDMAMHGKSDSAEIVLFPQRVAELKHGLSLYIESVFGFSAYREQPFLRGLYLSCATSDQQAVTKEASSDRAGFFLHDFFGGVLPRDRYLKRSTLLVDRWRQLTKNLALVAWVSFCTAIFFFLLVSYTQTKKTFIKIHEAFPDEQVLNSTAVDDQVVAIIAMKQVVDVLLAQEAHPGTRWLAFSPKVNQLEADIKEDFIGRVGRLINYQGPRLPAYADALSGQDTSMQADAVIVLTRQVNLLQARINGASYKDLQRLPQMPVEEAIRLGSVFADALRTNYGHMYTATIAWTPSNDEVMRVTLAERRGLLSQFALVDQKYTWLLDWADAQSGVLPVYLKDYWAPETPNLQSPKIRGAFTKEGAAHINSLLEEMRTAFNDSQEYQIRRAAFDRWYWSERVNAWQSFAWTFPQGQNLLTSETQWHDMLFKLNTMSGPFFQFVDRLTAEFADVDSDVLPDWLVFVREVEKYHEHVVSQIGFFRKFFSFFTAVNQVGGKSLRDSMKSGELLLPSEVKRAMVSLDAYRKFRSDFDIATADAVSGEGKSLQLLSEYFSAKSQGDSKLSTLSAASDSYDAFKKQSGYNKPGDQVVWNLLAAPMEMLIRYTGEQASCALQKDWEKSVYLKTQLMVTPKELSQQLYGNEGSVWAFLDGAAKPFVNQRADGFQPASAKGYVFPFTLEFFPYLNRSMSRRVEQIVREQRTDFAKGKSAKLTLTSRPLSVNPGAKMKPFAALLSLACSTGDHTLNNYNTANTETFLWSPEVCGDVTLQIKIDNMTLTRRYPGSMGLPNFISEFQDGERRFTPLDFPSVKNRLDDLGVKFISVRYDFTGADLVMQLADSLGSLSDPRVPAQLLPILARKQIQVPKHIGQCWSQGGADDMPMTTSMLVQRKAEQMASELNKPMSEATIKQEKSSSAVPTKRRNHPTRRASAAKPPENKAAPLLETRYFIQVGVFSSAQNIRAIEAQLTKIGYRMQLEAMDTETSAAQRVLAGPYPTKEIAAQALNRLTMLGMGGMIVKRPGSAAP